MTTSVAIGQCVQGDKEKPELTDMINHGYAVDLAELEGDDATGADVCQEYKVPSPRERDFTVKLRILFTFHFTCEFTVKCESVK